MSTPTGLWKNTVNVGFTPTGGTRSVLNRITKSDIDGGIENVKFAGDGDAYNTFNGNVMQDPSVTFAGGNISGILASIAGAVGSLDWTWPDAQNGIGVGSGAIHWVLSNAVVSAKSASNTHAAIATGSITFDAFSTDGTTNPLAFTIL